MKSTFTITGRTSFLFLLSLFFTAAIVFNGCKKDDDDDDNNNNNTTPQATYFPPSANNADGVFVGVKTVTYISQAGFEFAQGVNTAVAAVGNLETGDFDNIGAIDIDGEVIEIQQNNAYTYTFSGATTGGTTLGLDLDGGYTWNVTGGSGVSAFTHTVNMDFPEIGKISSEAETIDASSSYTLTVASIIDADSVLFHIAGPDSSVIVTKAGSSTSHTFTAAEVGTVGTGTGLIQVAGVKYSQANKGGKDLWFLNETVITDVVEFQ